MESYICNRCQHSFFKMSKSNYCTGCIGKIIVSALYEYGELSRKQIVQLTSIPRSTVHDSITRMGETIESFRVNGKGRPQTKYRMRQYE